MPNDNNENEVQNPNVNENENENENPNQNRNNNQPIVIPSPKSQSSAEGTRRVNPGTGKPKTQAQIQAALMMRRAKKVLNDALGIKSSVPEFSPLIKIMKRENFGNESAKQAAVNAYVAEIKAKRNAKVASASATATKKSPKKEKAANTNTTVRNKPKRTYVRKPKVEVPPLIVANAVSVRSTEKKPRRKVEVPSAAQSQYKTNMTAAKKFLNDALSIKSMPPEHNPLVGIMRKEYASEAEKKDAIDAHIEKIRSARAEKASKKATKGGSRKTKKNRS